MTFSMMGNIFFQDIVYWVILNQQLFADFIQKMNLKWLFWHSFLSN